MEAVGGSKKKTSFFVIFLGFSRVFPGFFWGFSWFYYGFPGFAFLVICLFLALLLKAFYRDYFYIFFLGFWTANPSKQFGGWVALGCLFRGSFLCVSESFVFFLCKLQSLEF